MLFENFQLTFFRLRRRQLLSLVLWLSILNLCIARRQRRVIIVIGVGQAVLRVDLDVLREPLEKTQIDNMVSLYFTLVLCFNPFLVLDFEFARRLPDVLYYHAADLDSRHLFFVDLGLLDIGDPPTVAHVQQVVALVLFALVRQQSLHAEVDGSLLVLHNLLPQLLLGLRAMKLLPTRRFVQAREVVLPHQFLYLFAFRIVL